MLLKLFFNADIPDWDVQYDDNLYSWSASATEKLISEFLTDCPSIANNMYWFNTIIFMLIKSNLICIVVKTNQVQKLENHN